MDSTSPAIVEVYYHSVFSDLPEDVEFDLIVCDEGHHEAMASFQYHLEKLGGFPILLLTATPDRADGMLIKFDFQVQPISREQAVKEGWLAPTHINSFVDASGKDKTTILTDILTNFVDEMGQTLVFVRTKKEARAIQEHLLSLGKRSLVLLDQTSKQMDDVLDQFAEGHYQFIVNCSKVSEGVDLYGCDTVLIGRTVGSYGLLNQIIGRASRVWHEHSTCNVWELINPLSKRNLDTTAITGVPDSHALYSKERGRWVRRLFNHVTRVDSSGQSMNALAEAHHNERTGRVDPAMLA